MKSQTQIPATYPLFSHDDLCRISAKADQNISPRGAAERHENAEDREYRKLLVRETAKWETR